MNNFAFLSLVEVIASISVGIHAYSRNPRARLNKVFFLFCANTSWSAFAEFVYLIADASDVAQLWVRLSFTWFIAALLLIFVLVFTKREALVQGRRRFLLLFGPPTLFSVVEFIPGGTILRAERMWWGWAPLYNNTLLNIIELAWGFMLTAGAFYLTWRYSRQTSETLQKKQALFIALTILCQILLGFTTVLVLPSLGFSFPQLPNLWLLIGCVFIGYAIAKYQLFALTPAAAAEGVIATMVEAFLLVDPRGNILAANPATSSLLGYSERELVNQRVESLFKDCTFDAPELHPGDLGVIMAPEQVRDLELSMRSKTGTMVPLSVSKSKLVDGKGQCQGFIFLLLDLTAIKRAEQAKLEERDYVTQEFISKFSHELRTPLNAIIGFSEVLVDQSLGPLNAHQLECAQDVWESGKYLLTLVNEILDLTGLEGAKVILSLEEFSLQGVIDALKPIVNQANRKKKHVIRYDVANGGNLQITSNKEKLQQVLLNLLTNAIKFTPPGGRVTIVVGEVPDGGAYFAVEDTGIGIPEANQQNIFGKFYHPDPQFEGTGLGLALSKHIVALLGGDLQFKSIPGKGSKFYFTLPTQFGGRGNESNEI